MTQDELNSKIARWREKSLDGSLTLEEMKEAIVALRGGRVSAAIASGTSRAKKAAAAVPVQDSDDLLDELRGG